MKKARIIVKEDVKGIVTDEGLQALDSIYYSPYEEFDDYMRPIDIINKLSEKYSEKYKNLCGYRIEIDFEEK